MCMYACLKFGIRALGASSAVGHAKSDRFHLVIAELLWGTPSATLRPFAALGHLLKDLVCVSTGAVERA